MKNLLGFVLLVLPLIVNSIPAHAVVLQPAHVFTLRDNNNDGSVDEVSGSGLTIEAALEALTEKLRGMA